MVGVRVVRFYRIRVNGVEYKVGVEKLEEGVYRVKVGEKEAEVFVEDSYDSLRVERVKTGDAATEQMEEKTIPESRGAVTAMLPGVVVKILVSVGDEIRAGDPIMVVESMKMENEIVSPYDGVVREIRVKEGQRIEAGDVLAVIG